ncbi:tetratricopeptide repeat protein [Pyxidicoccus trucidator]|uniref:tetratricopeptide repeat protein n=1 Tax=Pyxidicoccus trucidator TaxID=2709662 RepID=UPI0019674FB6|nr:tetratricopeptide repeat protein [Pyxidicoccus trucidator]
MRADLQSLEERLDRLRMAPASPEVQQAMTELTLELEEAVRREPRNAHLHYLVGRAWFYAERDDEAGRAFDEALRLAPEVAEYHYLRGFYLRFRQDLDGAAAELTRATELAPGKAKYHAQLGDTLAQKKDLPGALSAYQRALAIDPEHAESLRGRGQVLMEQGRTDEGVALLEKAAARGTLDDVTLRYNLGLHFQLAGKHARALEHFQAASLKAPEDWRILAKLVQEHQALGQRAERDARLVALRRLKQRGGVDSPFFVREQFQEAGQKVMVFEHFELEGERAVRYRFEVISADGESIQRTLSLGSYDFTNAVTQNRTPGVRLFHLDGYFPDNSHQTFAFFNGEPSYDDTRELIVEVLRGERKPVSGTRIIRKD